MLKIMGVIIHFYIKGFFVKKCSWMLYIIVLSLWIIHIVAILPDSSGVSGGLLGRAILLCLSLLVLLLPISCFSAKWALRVYALLVPLVAGEAYSLWHTGGLLTEGVAHALWSTHFGEAWEFFSSRGLLGGLLLLILGGAVVPCLLWVLAARCSAKNVWPRAYGFGVVGLLAFLLIALVWREGRLVRKHSFENIEPALKRQIHRTVPLGTVWKLYSAYRLKSQIESAYAGIAQTTKQLTVQALDSLPRLLVLWVGESSRRDHWQLYGYARPTTPRLSARLDLLRFDLAESPATLTWQAVPLLLNQATVSEPKGLSLQPNVLAYARQAGYRVTWISNQALDDSPLLQLQLVQADTVIRVGMEITKDGGYDERLLSEFVSLPPYPRQLVVLHSIGQHQRYDYRYPSDFDHFKPSLKNSSRLASANLRDQVINGYDNSIRYTDWILDSLINLLLADTSRSNSLLYVSDHGEALYDGPSALLGHGFPDELEVQTQIPLVLWSQEKSIGFSEDCPGSSPVSSDYMFETILDILKITSPGVDLNPSLLRKGCQYPRDVALPSDLLRGS